jgi:hypothetical protein
MRRTTLSLAIMLAAGSVGAQGLTMGTMNGWTFTFSGNVNAFLTYTDPRCSDPVPNACYYGIAGSLIPAGPDENVVRIRTGLAPGFAIFDAKGREGGLDLGAHFGFAPEIQSPNRLHDTCGSSYSLLCGTQVDMREVYLTAGGAWGQVLAGRAIGLFQKENLLTDMTVFGVGLSGGGAAGIGTSLGHIGTGYLYPNFNSQMTYSTPSNKEGVLQVGLFDPSVVNSEGVFQYTQTELPRLEAEYVYTKHSATANSAEKLMLYASGMVQQAKWAEAGTCVGPPCSQKKTITPWGLAAGGEWNKDGWQADLSGFYADGVGTAVMFDNIPSATDATGAMRTSYGGLLQLQYTFNGSKWKAGASYGLNYLQATDDDVATSSSFLIRNASSVVASGTYMWTKSLRWVFEYTYGNMEAYSGLRATSNQVAAGMMLFF